MGLENEAKKPVIATVPEALPKAKVATPVPKPLPLPLPEPRSKKSTPPVPKQRPVDDETPIRSRKWWIGSTQIKLACAGVVVALICVGGIVFLVSRMQLVEQAKKAEPSKETVQAKPTSAKSPVVLPPTKPAPATPPTNKPTEDTKPEIPVKKPTVPNDDPFTNPKPRLPDPVIPAATPELETLIKQLADKDETVRLKAAKELGRLKEKAQDAIPALKTASADQDEDVREVAKKSLVAIQAALGEKPEPVKPDPAKVEAKLAPLMKDLRSKDNKVRLAAIAKLDEMGEAAKPAGADLVEFGMMATDATVRDAANNVVEKIEPIVCKELITIYIDKSQQNKAQAVERLALMGKKAKIAVPMLRGYHNALFKGNEGKQAPAITIVALVSIIPEDESLQREVLNLVASDSAFIRLFNQWLTSTLGNASRVLVIELMHQLPIDNKSKYTALITAFSKSPNERVHLITEIAKLGADAKAALPVFKALKTDPDQAVRDAVSAAILKINQ